MNAAADSNHPTMESLQGKQTLGRDEHATVFGALQLQIVEAEQAGLSQAQLASAVVAILGGEEPEVNSANTLAYRIAWLAAVYAPVYDPMLITTLPFCLEGIVEGYATLEELFSHIDSSVPGEDAPALRLDLPELPCVMLQREVRDAVKILREDPNVLERIIDRIEAEDPDQDRPSGIRYSPQYIQRIGESDSVVNRWPPVVRDAVVSILQIEPVPRAVPLMKQIAGRLDPRSVRRLACELVHVSGEGAALSLRVRAAASLLAMIGSGHLHRG